MLDEDFLKLDVKFQQSSAMNMKVSTISQGSINIKSYSLRRKVINDPIV